MLLSLVAHIIAVSGRRESVVEAKNNKDSPEIKPGLKKRRRTDSRYGKRQVGYRCGLKFL